MKTHIKITAMLMAMMIGTLTAEAQSARRGNSQQKKTTASKSYNKPAKKTTTARQATPSRNSQSKARSAQRTQPQRTTTQRGSSYKKQPANNNNRNKTAYRNPQSTNRSAAVHTQTRNKEQDSRVQTQKYKKPNNNIHVGKTYVDPKPANKQYKDNKVYKGNTKLAHNANTKTHYATDKHHRHYYYPVERVKIHVHPLTYRSNYRALYYPRYHDIVWTRSMHRRYVDYYPGYTRWHYNYGYRLQTMSVFDARFNVNEVARVYGRVYATWFNHETDDLLLFFGGEYPNQVFTVVLPGNVARRYSWRPERYFLGEHVAVTGLISMFEGNPEMVIRKKSQINVY